jgi:hypothetical protein
MYVKGGGPCPSNRCGSNLSGFGKNCGDMCERPRCQNIYKHKTNKKADLFETERYLWRLKHVKGTTFA